jgi:hypothetical protein
MAASSGELLIVLADGVPEDVVEGWRERYRVLHVFSPRLLIVARGEDDPSAALNSEADVLAVLEPGILPPADLMGRLNPGETLFVTAWLERDKPKTRRGEGLAWDAPGYSPPDRLSE